MGKIGGSSWLTAVKKAFRSPSKENDKRTSRRREEHEQDEEEKKRGKRRWIFRKPSNHQETIIQHSEARNITTITNSTTTTTAINEVKNPISETTTDAVEQQRHAVAVAMATTAAAEAAVATAQAAVKFIRLTRPSIFLREHYAAIVVQTIFRGYLARRALRALKGLVKLQALVRGYNVRKRAKKTLQCMQSLVRVQTRVRDQRRRLSHEGSFDSMLSNPSSLWEDRKSISRDGSNVTGEWEDHTVEEIQAMLEKTKETAFIKREKALAYAFSHQMWRSGRESYASEEEPEKPRWTDRQWDTRRTSCDQRDPIRTVEIDTSRPYSYTPNVRRAQYQHHHYQQQIPSSHYASSPLHRAYQNQYLNSPITPPPLKAKPLQMHSASPRCLREERNYPTAQTPNLGSTYYHGIRGGAGTTAVPNYMVATASAKARVRSHSAPRQRPSTPEREKTGSAKKRLSFPVPGPYSGNEGNGGHLGMEQRSNMSSCCTESLGDDISPSSTYDLRRWLR